MRWHSLWACLTVAALVAAAPAQDTYTIKIKRDPDPGKSVTYKDSSTESGTVKILDADGNLLKEDKPNVVQDEVYTVTVIEKGDKRPKKFKRAYEKATRTVAGTAQARSYEGRTVVFELKDGKYVVTVEGDKPLDEMDLAELTKKANDNEENVDEVLLPKEAVKVGDKWPIDGKAVAKLFSKGGELSLDADKTKGDGTLLKVYKKDEKQFGVVEVKLKLAIKGAGGLKFDEPAVMDLTLALDTALDGSTTAGSMTMKGKMTGKAVLDQMGMKFGVQLNMDASGKEERTAEK
jgi:hypothetical protein